MSGFAIDEITGDLVYENGEIQVVEGLEETRQRLQSRLSVARGEWRFDTEFGTDYHGKIFAKKSLNEVDAELVRVVFETPKIIELLQPIIYDFDNTIRKLSAFIRVRAEDGEIELGV